MSLDDRLSMVCIDNYGCDDHAALAQRLQNPITERIPLILSHWMLDMLLTTSPKLSPTPQRAHPSAQQHSTQKQTQRNFKTPHTSICTTSSYHRSRRRALSPVQQKRQSSRPPLSLNAPPLPCKLCNMTKNLNSTPNLVPRWYRHERKKKKTKGNRRRWFKSEEEECWPFLLQRPACSGREALKGGACATKLFSFAKAWLIENSMTAIVSANSLTPTQKLTVFD